MRNKCSLCANFNVFTYLFFCENYRGVDHGQSFYIGNKWGDKDIVHTLQFPVEVVTYCFPFKAVYQTEIDLHAFLSLLSEDNVPSSYLVWHLLLTIFS